MGLDYLVRATLNQQASPILIEVNRFPGLEARGMDDEGVKTRVVEEAWICAAQHLGINVGDVGILPNDITTTDKDSVVFDRIVIGQERVEI